MELNGHELEYIDESHTYLVDGVIVPSVTQLLAKKFGHKYDGINPEVLKRAAEKGTAVHNAIEEWCKHGTESDLPELRNFKFLQTHYKFDVLANEIPVILFDNDCPIACGRLDLVLKMGDEIGLADIKRTSALDKYYVGDQLNIYRLAYQQTYGTEITFLKAMWLRSTKKDEKRKLIDIPINEQYTWEWLWSVREES